MDSIINHLCNYMGINPNNFDNKLVRRIYNKYPFCFQDVVKYFDSFRESYDKNIFTIIHLIMESGLQFMQKDPLKQIIKMSRKSIISLENVQDIIIYILECDIDELNPPMVDEILKSVQLDYLKYKKFILTIMDNFDIGEYLEYLEIYKSKELTRWYNKVKINKNGINADIWLNRLRIIAYYSNDINVWKRIFKIVIKLFENCPEIYYAERTSGLICNIIKYYCSHFDNYDYLYKLIWNTKIKTLLEEKKIYSELMQKLKSIHRKERIISTILSSKKLPYHMIRYIFIQYDN